MTFDTVLRQHRGIGPGFDFLRVFLALTIVLVHAFLLTGNDWIRSSPTWFLEYALVPMFFALSGFLISGSGLRLSLGNFLINRGLRIVPALAVDVFVCALIIGPVFTQLALSDYFTDPRFASYFLNVFGYIHYKLPGVFETNYSSNVNGALWTVPIEILCYVIISGLIITTTLKRRGVLLLLIIAYFAVGALVEIYPKPFGGYSPGNQAVRFWFVSRNAQLFFAFLVGIAFYLYRDRIPYSRWLFILCIGVCITADIMLTVSEIEHVATRIVLIPALTYITVFIGLTPVWLPKLFRRGDYSYGIYLYHDPILQCIISLAPVIAMMPVFGAAFVYTLGVPIVICLAAISWHSIEKPILSVRKKFSFVARVRGVEGAAIPVYTKNADAPELRPAKS